MNVLKFTTSFALLIVVLHHSIPTTFSFTPTIIYHKATATTKAKQQQPTSKKTTLLWNNNTNKNNNNGNDDDTTTNNNKHPITTHSTHTRRQTLSQIISTTTIITTTPLLLTTTPPAAIATPPPSPFTPAKRATAYLVDSTIPPTLVPFQPQRESAILKQLGDNSGTAKTPLLDDRINLNNILNKGLNAILDSLFERKKKKERTFIFLGTNFSSPTDGLLAERLVADMIKPRRGRRTGLGLSFVPLSGQVALDDYSSTGDEEALIAALTATCGVVDAGTTVRAQRPVLLLARAKGVSLVACAPEGADVAVVRAEGLQNVNVERRRRYVTDAEGFVNLTQDGKFRLYTEKSLLKDFVPLNDKDTEGDYFAERILVDEAVATAVATWSVENSKEEGGVLMIVLSELESVRFMGGANGRVPRICRFLDEASDVDEESVTTILLNPTAKTTLSQSRFLRLEIGTAPENLQYQTKLADYIWFSDMPKVNMLPRMMNPA